MFQACRHRTLKPNSLSHYFSIWLSSATVRLVEYPDFRAINHCHRNTPCAQREVRSPASITSKQIEEGTCRGVSNMMKGTCKHESCRVTTSLFGLCPGFMLLGLMLILSMTSDIRLLVLYLRVPQVFRSAPPKSSQPALSLVISHDGLARDSACCCPKALLPHVFQAAHEST